MGFQIVEFSVLRIFKLPIKELVGFADHYYLSKTPGLHNSIGWGPKGLELQGSIQVTPQESERIERFIMSAKYSISLNNCEHFANYVLHGINLSSQQHMWWKSLGADILCRLQPVQQINDNYNDIMTRQVADCLNENLERAKAEKANRERIEFWRARGIHVKS